jgi:hypothetical protein
MLRIARKNVFVGLALAVLAFCLPQIANAQVLGKGNLIGFVYGQDGTTPVEGAMIVVKNISTGKVFESGRSNNLGVFKFEGLDSGLYSLGVTGTTGSYNSSDLVGVTNAETAKIAIALSPYEKEVAQAVKQINKDQQEKGESRIGHVAGFGPGGKAADVFIERGLLQLGDRIHVKGPKTDFYQDTRSLMVQGAAVKKAFAGQNTLVDLVKPFVTDDVVYIVCKKGIPPLFLAPLGIAAVVAGSAVLTPSGNEETASDFTVK